MAFSLPGAFAAKLVHPQRHVVAAMGDGAFLMSLPEVETAVREGVHFVILVWVDGGYGLIRWKEEIQLGADARRCPSTTRTSSSWRRASAPRDTRSHPPASCMPTLEKALADEAVSIIACPVDYSENARLIERLGALTESI